MMITPPISLTLQSLNIANGVSDTLFIGGSGFDGNGLFGYAGNAASTASGNTAIGSEALQSIGTGILNNVIGTRSGQNITSGSYNVSQGTDSLASLVYGNYNTAMGSDVLFAGISFSLCTGIGYSALTNTNGSGNTAVGAFALNAEHNGAGAGYNTAIGNGAGMYDDPVTLGAANRIITGVQNTFIGAYTYPSVAGGAIFNAIAIGYKAQVGANNTCVIGNSSINMTIGQPTATARLHLPPGTATAGSAPLKFSAGSLLSALELGALEFTDDGTTGHLYITRNVSGILTRSLIV